MRRKGSEPSLGKTNEMIWDLYERLHAMTLKSNYLIEVDCYLRSVLVGRPTDEAFDLDRSADEAFDLGRPTDKAFQC